MSLETPSFPSRLSSAPEGLRRHEWEGGAFTTASRRRTALVEGEIRATSHLVMTTLSGGARRHIVRTDDGFAFDGSDRPGSASFLAAGQCRRLVLEDVEWRWAALAVDPASGPGSNLALIPSFVAPSDGFVTSMLAEFDRISALDGGLDPLWCDQMVGALAAYLGRSRHRVGDGAAPLRLAPWQLRRLTDHIDAQLSAGVRTSQLAALCGLSDGHFHRAFKATVGATPLGYVTQQRVARACRLLSTTEHSVDVIAFKVGFVSPSHFARIFRKHMLLSPAAYRKAYGVGPSAGCAVPAGRRDSETYR